MLYKNQLFNLLKTHGLSAYDMSIDLDIPLITLKRLLNGKEEPSEELLNEITNYFSS